MRTFSRGDVVRVPFPYIDKNTREHRPALVISGHEVGADAPLVWVLMITSARNRSWPGDVSLPSDPAQTGLRVPSVIRTAKIATIEARSAQLIGAVDAATLADVESQIAKILGSR